MREAIVAEQEHTCQSEQVSTPTDRPSLLHVSSRLHLSGKDITEDKRTREDL